MKKIDWLKGLCASVGKQRRIGRGVCSLKRRQAVCQAEVLNDRIAVGEVLGIGVFLAGGVLIPPALSDLAEGGAAPTSLLGLDQRDEDFQHRSRSFAVPDFASQGHPLAARFSMVPVSTAIGAPNVTAVSPGKRNPRWIPFPA